MFAGVFLLSPLVLGEPLIEKMMKEQMSLPDKLWHRLNIAWVAFFALLGAANLAAVYGMTCDGWVSFKLYGVSAFILAFTVAQGIVLGKYVVEKK
jgi:intracellular septation protein